MPIYKMKCERCGEEQDHLYASYDERKDAQCIYCGGAVKQMPTTFAFTLPKDK